MKIVVLGNNQNFKPKIIPYRPVSRISGKGGGGGGWGGGGGFITYKGVCGGGGGGEVTLLILCNFS